MATGTRYVSPVVSYYDNLGAPRAACQLYFFENGTTNTPKETFTDVEMENGTTSPRTADSSGSFVEFDIYLSGAYTVELRTGPPSLGEPGLIWRKDDVNLTAPNIVPEGQYVKGHVIAFYATTGSVDGLNAMLASGWNIANGSEGTPDLIKNNTITNGDNFIRYTDDVDVVGGEAGFASITLDSLTGTAEGHALTASENGPHAHNYYYSNSASFGYSSGSGALLLSTIPTSGIETTATSGSGTPHEHDVTINSYTFNNSPPHVFLLMLIFGDFT